MPAIDDVKLLLSTPAHRIELDDLIARELATLVTELGHERFSTNQGPIDEQAVKARVVAYEAAVGDMCVIGALVGRSGDASNMPSIAECSPGSRTSITSGVAQMDGSPRLGFRF